MSFKEFLDQVMKEYGITLTETQLAAFTAYYELLIEWNEKMNLTAITQPEEVAVKHMVDSLSCHDESVFKKGCKVIDVGTGAGFPGLPLKLLREDIELTLLDSLNKRLNFLQTVVEKNALSKVLLVHSRAEDGARKKELRERFDVAVSRAVARLNVLCELCLPYVKPGGYFVALKGAQYEQETAEAQNALKVLGAEIESVRKISLPGLEDVRAVLYIKKTKGTSSTYPRRPGTPEKKPL